MHTLLMACEVTALRATIDLDRTTAAGWTEVMLAGLILVTAAMFKRALIAWSIL